MMGNEGISVADALALRNSGNNGNDMFGGGNGAWWVIILILFFAVGGWGGNRNVGNGTAIPYCVAPPATAQGMADAFNFNQLDNGIRGLERGLCNGFYQNSQEANSILAALQNCCCTTQQNLLQGFNGAEKTIMQSDFHNQAGFNSLGNQLGMSTCDLERGQDAIKYEMSQLGNSLLVAGEKNTDRIINYLTQNELDKLRTELQSAHFQLSQIAQTTNIVNQLMPVAKPAYITCSPYASAFGFPQNQSCNTCM